MLATEGATERKKFCWGLYENMQDNSVWEQITTLGEETDLSSSTEYLVWLLWAQCKKLHCQKASVMTTKDKKEKIFTANGTQKEGLMKPTLL